MVQLELKYIACSSAFYLNKLRQVATVLLLNYSKQRHGCRGKREKYHYVAFFWPGKTGTMTSLVPSLAIAREEMEMQSFEKVILSLRLSRNIRFILRKIDSKLTYRSVSTEKVGFLFRSYFI